MTSFQKNIKCIAIGLAVFLSLCIVAVLSMVGYGLYGFFTGKDTQSSEILMEGTMNYQNTFSDIRSLRISTDTGDVSVRQGTGFEVSAVNVPDSFTCEAENGVLTITSKRDSVANLLGTRTTRNGVITVFVPKDFQAEYVKIANGAGIISTYSLAAESVEIEAGVGKAEFLDSNFGNLDMECGVGNIEFTGTLWGDCKISGGIGNVEFLLKGSYEDYSFKVDSGIGQTTINGSNYFTSTTLNPQASNIIKIDSGIGKIKIEFDE